MTAATAMRVSIVTTSDELSRSLRVLLGVWGHEAECARSAEKLPAHCDVAFVAAGLATERLLASLVAAGTRPVVLVNEQPADEFSAIDGVRCLEMPFDADELRHILDSAD